MAEDPYHTEFVSWRVDHFLFFVKTPTPTQHNTTVGFDMKMTVQTTPPPTQTFQALLDELES